MASRATTGHQHASTGPAQPGHGAPSAHASQRTGGSGATGEGLARVVGLLQSILDLQLEATGADAGVVLLLTGGAHAGTLAAKSPATLDASTVETLGTLANSAATSRAPALHAITLPGAPSKLYGDTPRVRALTIPLGAGEAPEAVAALAFMRSAPAAGTDRAQLAIARALAAPFEAHLWREHALEESSHKRLLRETIEILDAASRGEDTNTMGSIMTDELRRRFGCSRVSIGLVRGPAGIVRLVSASGAEDLDKRSEASEAIEHAMEECALQDAAVVYPAPADQAPEDARVVRAHESLNHRFGPSAIVSLPLRVRGDLVGVLVLEREATNPFPPGAIALLRLAAELVGPALWTRRLADRSALSVARDSVVNTGAWIVGPRHTGWKLFGLAILATVILASVVPIPRRVTADAEIRAETSRTVVPPYSGVLDAAFVTPGDPVTAGQPLAAMATDELRLQLAPLVARLAELRLQRDQASSGDQATAEAADLSIREVQAQVDAIQDRVDRATILSPIDGVISRGDLRDFVGARIEPTQPLFELVGAGRIVVIMIDERDVSRGLAKPGSTGWVSSRARPGVRIPIEVVRINPVAEAVPGGNAYRAEARITESASTTEWLRPGETGIVKLEAGTTTPLGAVFGPIADELRLRLWW